jgi:UDP-N-acetylglucosamine 2-epimerase (non-hydrolysing)
VLTARMTRWHFAPTATARERLLAEGIDSADVSLTGNTVIDALLEARAMIAASNGRSNGNASTAAGLGDSPSVGSILPVLAPGERLMLVTTHRRENFGAPLSQVCEAILTLLETNSGLRVLFPVHPNPHVGATVHAALAGHPRVTLCEPLQYLDFIAAMEMSHLILSDSGGVQEEAPALGKPVLVLRDETERPEAVAHGVVELVGTDKAHIVARAQRLLDDESAWRAMARGSSPYGDGYAAERIMHILRGSLCGEPVTLRPLEIAAGPSLQ